MGMYLTLLSDAGNRVDMPEGTYQEGADDGQVGSLRGKVMRGGLWVFAIRILSQVLRLVALIILARLLVPEDFGLLGITLLAIAVLEVFSETGFRQALIQKKGDPEPFMNTAWTVQAVRGLLLFGILYLAAPLVARFFNSPAAVPLLRVAGLTLVLRGLANIRVLYFQKRLEFGKEFVYQVTGSIAQVVVSVSLAIAYCSVWALVLGYISGDMVRLVFSYILIPRFPRPQLTPTHFKKMFAFGRWIFASGILMFLATQGDDTFVGKMLGATALGFYQLAYRMSNLPATEITHAVSQVTFPAYAKMQDDIPRLREAYLRVLQLTTFFAFPIAGMILVLGSDFTRLFLGEKWLPMIPAMMALALWGGIRSIGATQGSVFQAAGKPEFLVKTLLIAVLLLAVLIYPLSSRWGILGTSWAVVLSTLVATLVSSCVLVRLLDCKALAFCRIIAFPLAATVITVVSISVMSNYLTGDHGLVIFFVSTGIAVLLYLSVIYLFDRWFSSRILYMVGSSLALTWRRQE